jgi:hypothetical protein
LIWTRRQRDPRRWQPGDPHGHRRRYARAGFRRFRGSSAPDWLREHAYLFGFVLPYTLAATDRTGYIDEPWHGRWVGRALAGRLQSAGYQDWTDLDVDDVVAMVRTEASLDA